MSLKYESELLYELMKRDGDDTPSDVLPYESELKEKYLNQVVGAYPKLQDYRPEWLNYNLYHHLPSDFPVESVTNVTRATFQNVVPYAYGKAILKGSTKYRDIDTGEFLETFEEGRNLELVSVQMPVLTTIGKNVVNPIEDLFVYRSGFVKPQVLFENGGLSFISEFNASICGFRLPVKLLKDEMYYVKCDYENMTTIRLYGSNVLSDEIDTTWETIVISQNGGCFSFNKQFDYYYVGFYPNQNSRMKIKNLQIEQGTQSTSYEPYKSNILTVNEPVELRGIGDVRDELNLLTSELTENFEPFTLNGSEDWRLQDDSLENTTRFILLNYAPNKVNNQKIGITNTYEWGNYDKDKPGIILSKPSGHVYLRTSKMSVDELKTMLNNNPIHGYYNKEKSIKTVDLTCIDEQGGNVDFMPIEGTMHVSASSQTIAPLLEMSVPVEAITQNLNSFANMKEE